MALNWKSVTAEHVQQAFGRVYAANPKSKSSGIVVWDGDKSLSAKEVLRVAYRLANHLPEKMKLKFSSGDATLSVLSRLGFRVERLDRGTPKA